MTVVLDIMCEIDRNKALAQFSSPFPPLLPSSFSFSLPLSLLPCRCRVMTRGMVEDYIYLRREMFIDVCVKQGVEGGRGGRG